jgi:hypothetical protein
MVEPTTPVLVDLILLVLVVVVQDQQVVVVLGQVFLDWDFREFLLVFLVALAVVVVRMVKQVDPGVELAYLTVLLELLLFMVVVEVELHFRWHSQ